MDTIYVDASATAKADDYLASILAQVKDIMDMPANVRAYLAKDLKRIDDDMPSRVWCETRLGGSGSAGDLDMCPELAVTVIDNGSGRADALSGRCEMHAPQWDYMGVTVTRSPVTGYYLANTSRGLTADDPEGIRELIREFPPID